jgi:hypothetical protein
LVNLDPPDDLVDRVLPAAQRLDDAAAGGIGQGLEGTY